MAVAMDAMLCIARRPSAMIDIARAGRRAGKLFADPSIRRNVASHVFASASCRVSQRHAHKQKRSKRGPRQLQECLECECEPHDNRNSEVYRFKLAAIL